MRRSLCTAAALLVALPATATIHPGTIDGDEAQASTCAVGSTSRVVGTVSYDDVTGEFSWSYTYGDNAPDYDDGDLFGAGVERPSHFHGPALPGVLGSVVVPTGTGTPNAGSVTISALQGADLLDDLWYLNIHSTTCLNGEMRGQVLMEEVTDPPIGGVPSLSTPMFGILFAAMLGITRWGTRRQAPPAG